LEEIIATLKKDESFTTVDKKTAYQL